MERFYCCFVEGTGGFTVRHLTMGDARAEAMRLAQQPKNHGKKVFVLMPMAYCLVEWLVEEGE